MDVLEFVANLLLCVGVVDEELNRRYLIKYRENLRRRETGRNVEVQTC